jgi:hypothetical protein
MRYFLHQTLCDSGTSGSSGALEIQQLLYSS